MAELWRSAGSLTKFIRDSLCSLITETKSQTVRLLFKVSQYQSLSLEMNMQMWSSLVLEKCTPWIGAEYVYLVDIKVTFLVIFNLLLI